MTYQVYQNYKSDDIGVAEFTDIILDHIDMLLEEGVLDSHAQQCYENAKRADLIEMCEEAAQQYT
jgi:hypothetical protein